MTWDAPQAVAHIAEGLTRLATLLGKPKSELVVYDPVRGGGAVWVMRWRG